MRPHALQLTANLKSEKQRKKNIMRHIMEKNPIQLSRWSYNLAATVYILKGNDIYAVKSKTEVNYKEELKHHQAIMRL